MSQPTQPRHRAGKHQHRRASWYRTSRLSRIAVVAAAITAPAVVMTTTASASHVAQPAAQTTCPLSSLLVPSCGTLWGVHTAVPRGIVDTECRRGI